MKQARTTRATAVRTAIGAFACLLLLAACNALTGLSREYTFADCADAACLDATTEPGDDGGTSRDASVDAADAADATTDSPEPRDAPSDTRDAAAACDPDASLAAALASPIAPPWSYFGVDLHGASGDGITVDEITRILCGATDAGGGGAVGSNTIAWADGAAQLTYDIASGQYEIAFAGVGYKGPVLFTSADGAHHYRIAIGEPLTKDGLPFAIDWGTAAAKTQMDELYRALAATFKPSAPPLPPGKLCTTDKTLCSMIVDSQGHAYLLFRGVRLDVYFSNTSDAGPLSITPESIYSVRPDSYNAIDDVTRWTTIDTTAIAPSAKGFAGVEGDAFALYLVPNAAGTPVARYAVSSPQTFAHPPSGWMTFDPTVLDPGAKSFQGGCSDGYQRVYFAPGSNGVVTAYDWSEAFPLAASWSTFDTTTLTPPASRFAGAVNAVYGNLVLFVPAADGVVAAFTTGVALDDAASWTSADLTKIDARFTRFHGGVSAGQYVYLAPHGAAPAYSGVVAQWNTQSALNDPAGWSSFDLRQLDPQGTSIAYAGAVFDNRYVYFVPAHTGAANQDLVRYDTTKPFTAAASWELYQIAGGNYTSGIFDGRYVYFSGTTSIINRFDTTQPFTLDTSWTYLDVSFIDPKATAFAGSAFDGRFVYFVPDTFSTLARFDAKFPPGPGLVTSTF